ncbi:MAG: DsbE family thiol:disulfide interchange protein, partial [Steroidobacteraceae bacterium]|nr:DsbE family thiol:disulfide interchange protein [Steroidobacteraceae bacterium]MDW8258979.1 DsbE family thiol:disulfide interchange protein [Gammaproteobacteria bacterium]
MTRFVAPLLGFGVLAIVLAIGVQRAPEKSTLPSALLGRPAPAIDLPTLLPQPDGTMRFRSEQMRGQWYLLNVWGTWCAECRVEHDVLLAIRATGKAAVVGLNWKDDRAAALRWLQELGDPYAVVAVDEDGRTAIDYGVYGAPETFLIDPNGIVRYRKVG